MSRRGAREYRVGRGGGEYEYVGGAGEGVQSLSFGDEDGNGLGNEDTSSIIDHDHETSC